MADILKFEKRERQPTKKNSKIEKMIDGKLVELTDFEALTPDELSRILTANTIAQQA